MFQNQIPRWAMAVVIVLALIGLGSAIHNAGWSQGFTMGLLAGSGDGSNVSPYLMYGARPGGHFGGFFGGIFRIFFFLFIFAMIARFFVFRHWRMHGPHGPWRHHYGPPWAEHYRQSGGSPTAEKGSQNNDSTYI